MQNYSKVGGVLSIIAGAFGVLGLFMMVGVAILIGLIFSDPGAFDGADAPPEGLIVGIIAIYALMGLFYAAAGALAIVGGVFALKKKYWRWSLAGAIAGSITFNLCGIPAIIFVCLGKSEFNVSTPLAPAPTAPPPLVVQT